MKGCLFRFCLFPIIIGTIYPLLLIRSPFPTIIFPAEGAEVTAIVTGLLLWFALISFWDMRRYDADRAQLNQGILRDGERIVVAGVIEPKETILKAPFSGKECIGYYYKVEHSTSGASGITTWMDYEGYALILSIIKCPLGDIKILADSDKELFYELPLVEQKNEMARIYNYLESCSFDSKINGPGSFCTDKKIGESVDLTKCEMKESIVKQGDLVLVAGIYSSVDGGIKPHPDSIMRPFHIVPGGEADLQRKTKNRLIAIFICLGISAGALAIYFLMFGQATIF